VCPTTTPASASLQKKPADCRCLFHWRWPAGRNGPCRQNALRDYLSTKRLGRDWAKDPAANRPDALYVSTISRNLRQRRDHAQPAAAHRPRAGRRACDVKTPPWAIRGRLTPGSPQHGTGGGSYPGRRALAPIEEYRVPATARVGRNSPGLSERRILRHSSPCWPFPRQRSAIPRATPASAALGLAPRTGRTPPAD